MRCFYHHDKEAVGSCKSCAKGLCGECAVDLGKGLACRARCEDAAGAIIALIDRNIRMSAATPTAYVVTPSAPVVAPSPTSEFITLELSRHIRVNRKFRWRSGMFYLIIGASLVAAGLTQQLVFLDVLGGVFLIFGAVILLEAMRCRNAPQLPQTVTR